MQEDLEVTGVSRSGRVRKKSSKLMDFESPDDIDTKLRRQTPVKSYSGMRQTSEIENDYPDHHNMTPQRPVVENGAGSGSESDFYDNGENVDSMESDSSGSDEGSTRTPANSLYMMEKSTKKKLIVKDGRVVGRAKAQRKDKGKTRITAYMMWAKEARNDLLRKYPEMDFSAISKRLGEMWANVNYNERYLWKRKAKRFAMQKDLSQGPVARIISNPIAQPRVRSMQGPGRPPNKTPKTYQVVSATTPQIMQSSSVSPPGGVFRVSGCGALEVAAHLRLLGDSLAIIGERLQEHEGQIAVSGSVSVLLDSWLCAVAALVCLYRADPRLAPPEALLRDTLHNIAYIMPGL